MQTENPLDISEWKKNKGTFIQKECESNSVMTTKPGVTETCLLIF